MVFNLVTRQQQHEQVFCSSPNAQSIMVIAGPGAVTGAQMKSTLACSVVGGILVSLLFLSLLLYWSAGITGTIMFLIVFALAGAPRIRSFARIWQATKKFSSMRKTAKTSKTSFNGDNSNSNSNNDNSGSGNDDSNSSSSNDDHNRPAPPLSNFKSLRSIKWSLRAEAEKHMDQESEGVHVAKETYRVSKPTKAFATFLFVADLMILLIWPTIALLFSGNLPLALCLIILALISKTRYLFDAALALEEAGKIDVLGGLHENTYQQPCNRRVARRRASFCLGSNAGQTIRRSDGECARRQIEPVRSA